MKPNPAAVGALAAAEHDWVSWEPGDGTHYAIRVVPLTIGSAAGDIVLLVMSVAGESTSIQLPRAAYRHVERGPWSRTRWRRTGHPEGWWSAVRPLLIAAGVPMTSTEKRNGSGLMEDYPSRYRASGDQKWRTGTAPRVRTYTTVGGVL